MTKEQSNIRVGIVASTPLRQLGLSAILEEMPGVRTVALELDAAVYEEGLGMLVLDVRTPLDTVVYAVGRVLQQQPQSRILVLGEAVVIDEVQTIIAAGAKGFLAENASESEIKMAASVVLDGAIWGPRKVLARLIEEKRTAEVVEPEGVRFDAVLSERELEVLELLKHGRSNSEIAAVLGVEEATVKSHISKMMRKTHARSRLELTLRALEVANRS